MNDLCITFQIENLGCYSEGHGRGSYGRGHGSGRGFGSFERGLGGDKSDLDEEEDPDADMEDANPSRKCTSS